MFVFAAVLRVLVHHDCVADDDTDEADDTQDGGDGYIQAEEPQTEHRAEDTEHGAGEGQQGKAYLPEMIQQQDKHDRERRHDRP